jgi:hypothetical protein
VTERRKKRQEQVIEDELEEEEVDWVTESNPLGYNLNLLQEDVWEGMAEEPEPSPETPEDDLTDLDDEEEWIPAPSVMNDSTRSGAYYTKSDYDWENDQRWKSDSAAIRYKNRIDEGRK